MSRIAGLLFGGCWWGWPGPLGPVGVAHRGSPVRWLLVGVAGAVRSSWCRASRVSSWVVAGRGWPGWVRSSSCRALRVSCSVVAGRGWVRSSWCRASRVSCSVVAGRGWPGPLGPVGVAHRGSPLGWWLVGVGRGGLGPVGVAHCGSPVRWLLVGVAGAVRSSWCRASRVSCSVVAGRGWPGPLGPVRVAHRGSPLGWWLVGVSRGGSGPVRVAHRGPPVRWWLVGVGRGGSGPVGVAHRGSPLGWLLGVAGVGQVQFVSRIAGLLLGGCWGWPGWVRSSSCRASRASCSLVAGWGEGSGRASGTRDQASRDQACMKNVSKYTFESSE